MKKLMGVFAVVAVLSLALICVGVVSAQADDIVSPGPAPGSGDGVSDGPEFDPAPPFGSVNGPGPAANAGDGV